MIRRNRVIPFLSLFSAAMVAVAAPSGAQTYAGKNITLLIGYGAGSGVTSAARSFVPHWRKHIPGNPNIVVKNLTGGGGVKAQNFMYEKAKPDGLTIYWGPIAMIGQLISSPGVRAKYEEFEYIGGSGRTLVTYIRKAAVPGFSKPADILKAQKPLAIACTRQSSNLCILQRLSFEMLGVPYRIVPGYRGASKILAALRQNEVDTHSTPDHTYRSVVEPTYVNPGAGAGIYYFPPIDAQGNAEPNKNLSHVKNFVDLYTEIHGKPPSGPKWKTMKWIQTYLGKMVLSVYAPPGTPKKFVEELRKSYAATANDEVYLAEYLKQFHVPLNVATAAEGEKFFSTFKNTDPEILALLKEYGVRAKRGKKKQRK